MSSICTCHPPSVHHVTSNPSLNTRRRASRQSCCVAAFHRPSHTAAPAGTPSLTSRHARSSTRSMPRPTTLHRFSPCHFRCRPLLPQHPQFAGHLYDSVPRRRDPLLEIEPRFLLRGSGASDGPIPMGAGTLHAITPRSASHSDASPPLARVSVTFQEPAGCGQLHTEVTHRAACAHYFSLDLSHMSKHPCNRFWPVTPTHVPPKTCRRSARS